MSLGETPFVFFEHVRKDVRVIATVPQLGKVAKFDAWDYLRLGCRCADAYYPKAGQGAWRVRALCTFSILKTAHNPYARFAEDRRREGMRPAQHGVLPPVVLEVVERIKISGKEYV